VTSRFRLELLGKHDRSAFSCGKEPLDRYLKTQASQDASRRVANCFVAVENDTEHLAAFYTLSASSIFLGDLPPEARKKLPRYPTVGAMLIGRLAVDLQFQKCGLGSAILADAVHKALQSAEAVYALLVDAMDDDAVAFYARHGFGALVDKPRTMFLPIATAAKLLGR
jgi:GNAT superfamily N-acetyltransferase